MRPLIVSTIYLATFVLLRRLTTGLDFLPDVGSWNLLAGLSFGLLLGYGPLYAPVVLLAFTLIPVWPNVAGITDWQILFPALTATSMYVFASEGIRKVAGSETIDLTDRNTLAAWLLAVPPIAASVAALLVIETAYINLLDWNHVSLAILRGTAGNACGILLVTPLVVLSNGWTRPWRTKRKRSIVRLDADAETVAHRPRTQLLRLLLSVSFPASTVLWLYFLYKWPVTDAFFLFCMVSLPLLCLSLEFGMQGAAVFLVALGVIAANKAAAGQWTDFYSQIIIIFSAINGIGVGLLVSERNLQRVTMNRQAALLNSVSFATERLLGMKDQEKNLDEVLRQLAAEAKVSRIYVLKNREEIDSSGYPVVYECSALEFADEQAHSRLNAIRSNHVRMNSSFLADDKALQFRTSELSEQEQETLLSVGIHVGIILPIFADGRWWGCLGLDQCSTDQPWSEPEVSGFKATAHVLGSLLAHANVEQQFRQFTGNIPAVFWIAAPDLLHKTYVSPAYEQIWGVPCKSIYEQPASWLGAIYHEDYSEIRDALDNMQGGEYDLEYRIVRPNHEVRWIRDTAFPVCDASGQVSRVVGIAQDITPQKEAEERLRANSILLSTLIDNLPVGIVVEDHSRRIMHVNHAFCEMFDVADPLETLIGMDSRRVLPQFSDKRMDEIAKKAITCRAEELRVDGRVFTRDYIPLLVDGNWRHHLWQYEDITERKENEEQIRRSLTEKEVLLKEIHHRVKNNLQIISSLMNLQSAQIRDDQMAQLFRDSDNRVRAMALVHERLYQSADLARIDFAGYVQDITNHLLRSYQTNLCNVRLKVDVDPVSLNIDTAIPCALIIHELVSNALKYAFPDGRQGEIRVRLQGGSDELDLVISDNGVGFPKNVSFESSGSLGLTLVRSLTEQLKGKIGYGGQAGTEFHIKFRAVHERKQSVLVAG